MVNPNTVANDIIANCEAYANSIINRARWDAEQCRLWRLAADAGLASVVMTLVLRTSATGMISQARGGMSSDDEQASCR